MMNKQAGATKRAGIFSAFGTVASAALPFVLASDETTKHTIERIDDALALLASIKACQLLLQRRI